MAKGDELRSLIRKRGYRVLELHYNNYSDKNRDQMYNELLDSLGRE